MELISGTESWVIDLDCQVQDSWFLLYFFLRHLNQMLKRISFYNKVFLLCSRWKSYCLVFFNSMPWIYMWSMLYLPFVAQLKSVNHLPKNSYKLLERFRVICLNSGLNAVMQLTEVDGVSWWFFMILFPVGASSCCHLASW